MATKNTTTLCGEASLRRRWDETPAPNHPESYACVFTYASLSTYFRAYRFYMAGFDGFGLQCRSAAFAGTGNRHPI